MVLQKLRIKLCCKLQPSQHSLTKLAFSAQASIIQPQSHLLNVGGFPVLLSTLIFIKIQQRTSYLSSTAAVPSESCKKPQASTSAMVWLIPREIRTAPYHWNHRALPRSSHGSCLDGSQVSRTSDNGIWPCPDCSHFQSHGFLAAHSASM